MTDSTPANSTLANFKQHPFLVNGLILALALVFSFAVGAVFIPPATVLRILTAGLGGDNRLSPELATFSTILLKIRLPHAVLVCLTGAALGGSGAAYQGLFRNPLADPYLIGVASGAGLGAVMVLASDWPNTLAGFYAVPLAAFLGALLTVILVYNLARVNQALPTTTLILAGVAVSAFATSLTSFLMLRSSDEVHRALAWLLGGAAMGGWQPVLAALPYILIGLFFLVTSGHTLNVLQFGEEQASQLGLNVERAKWLLILAASLTTAAAVSFSGLIGFIGLVIPHMMRILWGPDYQRLIPLSIIGGASALLLADMLARSLLAPQTLPVGIITALAGAPFFLWIMRRAKKQIYW